MHDTYAHAPTTCRISPHPSYLHICIPAVQPASSHPHRLPPHNPNSHSIYIYIHTYAHPYLSGISQPIKHPQRAESAGKTRRRDGCGVVICSTCQQTCGARLMLLLRDGPVAERVYVDFISCLSYTATTRAQQSPGFHPLHFVGTWFSKRLCPVTLRL